MFNVTVTLTMVLSGGVLAVIRVRESHIRVEAPALDAGGFIRRGRGTRTLAPHTQEARRGLSTPPARSPRQRRPSSLEQDREPK